MVVIKHLLMKFFFKFCGFVFELCLGNVNDFTALDFLQTILFTFKNQKWSK